MGCNCNNGVGGWLILLILLCGFCGNGGLMGGCGLVAYLVAAIIMPVKPDSIV